MKIRELIDVVFYTEKYKNQPLKILFSFVTLLSGSTILFYFLTLDTIGHSLWIALIIGLALFAFVLAAFKLAIAFFVQSLLNSADKRLAELTRNSSLFVTFSIFSLVIILISGDVVKNFLLNNLSLWLPGIISLVIYTVSDLLFRKRYGRHISSDESKLLKEWWLRANFIKKILIIFFVALNVLSWFGSIWFILLTGIIDIWSLFLSLIWVFEFIVN